MSPWTPLFLAMCLPLLGHTQDFHLLEFAHAGRTNGKRYDETFKKETVRYILANNKPVAQIARETGVNTNTLYSWIKKYSEQPEVKAVQTFSTPEAELKAMHYFAKSPR